MARKKPRQHLQVTEQPKQKPIKKVKFERKPEFYSCAEPNCANVVASWAEPNGSFRPVYCVLHREAK